MPAAHLAIDLGASSGRAIVGVLDGDPLTVRLHETHRFEHLPCPTPAGPVWDLTGIWLNILEGIKRSVAWCDEQNVELHSIGVDTWGVDWCLVDRQGELVGLPHCYRDPQNELACQRVLEKIGGKEALYQRTGIQLMAINTLFQVAARFEKSPGLFASAERLLFIPDLFHYWLSGEMTCERTIASTSSLLKLETGEWDFELMEMIGVPTKIFGTLIDPGKTIGTIRNEIADATGVGPELKVIAPGAHDTASAIAAVPALSSGSSGTGSTGTTGRWAYLSSGTWSLLGTELDQSFGSAESCDAPFTNELGISGTTRFLKNIAGLWLVQELRREFVGQGDEVSFSELADEARNALPYRTLIDPNASQFAEPGRMAEKIQAFARDTDQPVPESRGELVRCCLDSLALCYRETVDLLESVLGIQIDVLHIVGGGTNNLLLNEITAAAMERPVVCGPVEATAIGNVLTQAMGCGEIKNLTEIREVVSRSFRLHEYLTDDVAPELVVSKEVFARFSHISGRS